MPPHTSVPLYAFMAWTRKTLTVQRTIKCNVDGQTLKLMMLSDVMLQLCAANIQRGKGALIPTTETTETARTIATPLTWHRSVNSCPLHSPR
jgi:hypothetical protein